LQFETFNTPTLNSLSRDFSIFSPEEAEQNASVEAPSFSRKVALGVIHQGSLLNFGEKC
jgi:hypothetical protein